MTNLVYMQLTKMRSNFVDTLECFSWQRKQRLSCVNM